MVESDQLVVLLRDFIEGRTSFAPMHYQVIELLKQGVGQKLSNQHRNKLNEFMKYADAYNPQLQPREGFWGRARDCWDQATRGQYRISIQEVKTKAEELADLLSAKISK